MRKFHILAVAVIVGAAACLAAAQAQAAKKGDKPKDSPGWVVVEEDWFYPFRYESAEALHRAGVHFRQNEEKAAANELRKAESWLKYASGHAYPETKKSLQDAASDLHTLANDIEQGKVTSARHLDQTIAKAANSLAEWHYFRAKQHLGQDEEKWAAQDLQTAARHLQAAASSAQYEYGPDYVTLFDDVDQYGRIIAEGVDIDRDSLSKNLTALQREIKKLGKSLKDGSTS